MQLLAHNYSVAQSRWTGLRASVENYVPYWGKDKLAYAGRDLDFERHQSKQILNLLQRKKSCFDRSHFDPGHVTGSALITNPTLDLVLLTHHRKLDKWLQLGGHSDGSSETFDVAFREAEEESGLSEFSFFDFAALSPSKDDLVLFDLDVHEIPERPNKEPAHKHFDVRFLLLTDHNVPFTVSDESHDLKWFKIEEAMKANSETSMLRQFAKLEHLRKLITKS